MFGHTIDAPEIASIGNRHADIINRSPERVDKGFWWHYIIHNSHITFAALAIVNRPDKITSVQAHHYRESCARALVMSGEELFR